MSLMSYIQQHRIWIRILTGRSKFVALREISWPVPSPYMSYVEMSPSHEEGRHVAYLIYSWQ